MATSKEAREALATHHQQFVGKTVKIDEQCAWEGDIGEWDGKEGGPILLIVLPEYDIFNDTEDYTDMEWHGRPLNPSHPALADDVAGKEVYFRGSTWDHSEGHIYTHSWEVVDTVGI